MILYLIQAHKEPDQVVRLVRLLRSPRSVFLVNLDPAMSDSASYLETALGGEADTSVRIGIPINWGGISQVYALLDALKFALSLPKRWDFVVNLSADTIPLKRPEVIHSYYSSQRRSGRRVFMSMFGAQNDTLESKQPQGFLPSAVSVLPFGTERTFDADCRSNRFFGRVPAYVDAGLDAMFADRDRNPVFRTRLRGSLHVSDLIVARKLAIRRLLPHEAEYRSRSLGSSRLHAGRAWYTLERSAVHDILEDPLATDIIHHLEHYLCPDELFLQTVVMNSERFEPHEIILDNQRFKHGDSLRITDGMTDELMQSKSFFARKVRPGTCGVLLDRLVSQFGERGRRSAR